MLAGFCVGTRYGDLSPGVVDRAKYFALAFIGVAARGTPEAPTRISDRLSSFGFSEEQLVNALGSPGGRGKEGDRTLKGDPIP